MAMYGGASTVVRTVYGNSNSSEVRVAVHQGSAQSPLVFVIVMEAISREIAEDYNELIRRLNQWKSCCQGKGLQVNVSKTKVKGVAGLVMRL